MSWKILAEQDEGDFDEAAVVDALMQHGFYDITIEEWSGQV